MHIFSSVMRQNAVCFIFWWVPAGIMKQKKQSKIPFWQSPSKPAHPYDPHQQTFKEIGTAVCLSQSWRFPCGWPRATAVFTTTTHQFGVATGVWYEQKIHDILWSATNSQKNCVTFFNTNILCGYHKNLCDFNKKKVWFEEKHTNFEEICVESKPHKLCVVITTQINLWILRVQLTFVDFCLKSQVFCLWWRSLQPLNSKPVHQR
jgi:hypothetical protein